MSDSSDESGRKEVSRYALHRRKRARTEENFVNVPSDESEEQDSPPNESGMENDEATSSSTAVTVASFNDQILFHVDNDAVGAGSSLNDSSASTGGGAREDVDNGNLFEADQNDLDAREGVVAEILDDRENTDGEDELLHEEGYNSEAMSDSDTEEDADQDAEENISLYPGAPISIKESLMTILTLAMKHRLTGTCIGDILKLISIHCPAPNNCLTTLYKFKKYFSMIGNSSLTFHYYCSDCSYPVESKDSVCESCEGSNNSYFIEIPLKAQLQTMLMRRGFFANLQYRFERRKKNDENIEDIYDGQMYQDHFLNHGFLANQNNISLSWYTDGISVFRSSKFSIWPLYFVINELNYTNRTLRENVILAGLWFGPSKPNPNLFLQPFHSSLTEFYNQGYEMNVSGRDPILMKGMLLCGVADLPAKSLFMNFKQHNGAFGCGTCVTQGMRYDLGHGSVQVYPYSHVVTMRNNEDVEHFARQAVELRQRNPEAAVFGVKGPTVLYKMVPNMVRSTCIDKMHGIDYGVFKQVMNLMFDPSFSNEQFSSSAMVVVIDDRLSKIKPPSFEQRLPRSIKNHMALWKSAEYKLLLMILSIPIFLGVVDDVYLNHHCLLVSAVYLLNQCSISMEHINVASELLHSYVSQFENLYGVRYMSMNVHQLLHLPQVVKDNGPLWVYACYFYEDLNGKFSQLIHGTRHAGMQVCSAASAFLNLPVMISVLPEGSAARTYCENVNSHVKCVKIADEISTGVYAVGTYCDFLGSADIENATALALQNLGIRGGHCKYFYRLRKKGVLYYSSLYQRSIQKESSYAQIFLTDEPRLGRIIHFVKWTNCGPNCIEGCVECPARYFAVLTLYERQVWHIHNIPNIRLPYLNKVSPTNIVVACPVSNILSLCYYLNVDNSEYIITPVNELEDN